MNNYVAVSLKLMQVTVMPWEKLPHGQAHRLDLPGGWAGGGVHSEVT